MNAVTVRTATKADFAQVFPLIQALWSYNVYDEAATRAVYEQIVRDAQCGGQSHSFAFVARKRDEAERADGGDIIGFCHGDFFNTLWMCGKTCYLSGIITAESERKRGVGSAMLAAVKAVARERGAKAIILESGLSRTEAHRFYEAHGFEKTCYGFELTLG